MIKLNALYSKKIPAEVEYSSQNYSAALEIEVAENTLSDAGKLQQTLQWLWGELKKSVEDQISRSLPPPIQNNGKANYSKNNGGFHNYGGNGNNGNGNGNGNGNNGNNGNGNGNSKKASNKQIQFLINLAKNRQHDFPALRGYVQNRFGKDVYDLSSHEASNLIQEYK